MSNWCSGGNLYFSGTISEHELVKLAQKIAKEFFDTKLFVELRGELGVGKTVFARAFISTWLSLAGESNTTAISPTYNIVQVYGSIKPVAHFDLYRISTLNELEQIGFEHYFYELPCTLVEWPEKIEAFEKLRPQTTVIVVSLEFFEEAEKRAVRIDRLDA